MQKIPITKQAKGKLVLQTKTKLSSWGIGLNKEQAETLAGYLGSGHQLVLYDGEKQLSPGELEASCPFIIWLTTDFCKKLRLMNPESKRFFDAIPKVLLLQDGYTLEDFEIACDCGITDIIRGELTKERVAELMRRALEAQSIHHDVQRMTREIALERELLERKNELLGFLVNFLTNTTESLDLEYILQTAFTGLGRLLPVQSMHAALWEQDERNSNLSLYLCAPENSQAHRLWHSTLLEQAKHMAGKDFSIQESTRLHLPDQSEEWMDSTPEKGIILNLPIVNGPEQLGMLVLVTSSDRPLGRDQAVALDSAMRHFALSIKNARRFRLMQTYADYDSLTKVHSRRHFENRLEEEMQRFTRYGQSLSLVMLDIDHFKHINDTWGHHIGDIILREVATIIAESIRTTDYCARYGGEEFVILMPHTSGKNAVTSADRLRTIICNHSFVTDGTPIHLTVSLGVASLSPGKPKNKQALLCEADAALYYAKQNGRNRTCDSSFAQAEDQALAG